jgi:SAM-dependent methyltransferase
MADIETAAGSFPPEFSWERVFLHWILGNAASNCVFFDVQGHEAHFSRNNSLHSFVLENEKEGSCMAEHVCPWWMGYFLASPMRRLIQKPEAMLQQYVKEGMTVLEIGPGMGFFTIPIAKMVGPDGKVIVTDIQRQMLDNLKKRAQRAGVADRIECRQGTTDSLGIDDVNGTVDFALAFAVVHEIPDKKGLFMNIYRALKNNRLLYVADPKSHCPMQEFDANVSTGKDVGFSVEPTAPVVRNSYCSILRKK